MKVKYFPQSIVCSLFFLMAIISCKKDDNSNNNSGNNLTSINGSWQTTVWGGPNDTARMTVSTGTGTLSYLNAGAMTTRFSVNDVIYSNIVSTGTNTYSATANYRYTASGGTANGTTAHSTAVFTLQNGGSTLYVHPAPDAGTGITPPDYYWYKQ